MFRVRIVVLQHVSFLHSSQGFWQVPSASWSLGGTKKERSGNTTILDTGTTLCLVSDDVVDELYGQFCLRPSHNTCH